MHIFIAGGSGQTGSLVIDDLLGQNHTVTALVRNTAAIRNRIGLDLVQGTPVHKADIQKSFSHQKPDVVIVTLASAKGTFEKGSFLTHVICNIVSVMEEYSTDKIVYMSAFGVGDSYPELNFLMRAAVCITPLGGKFLDHEGAEQVLKATDRINFVVVRPAMLTTGDKGKVKFLGLRREKWEFMPSITRASVAGFIVEAAGSQEWIGKTPVISNA
ncbi:hypothetical protein BGW36DRAFT_308570 [Talaromyces proteolyticus]|uniref:NAD(P)-binding domain-containing protein n=1 Tax=Talaromyces proteolyticus TaxID=1131652 RepID=A0AAD4KFU4_9EURO|nr:uncharacterized protein BGW36DRAFT_308570 [Talaromyces proteolyticus]KAH8689381.1 hypothetical protein BGW36DRAFT_308570 [Talaromyces proteolyticus]